MKQLNLLLLFFAITTYSQTNYQKVRIYYNSQTDLESIIQKGEIDHFKKKEGVYIECDIPEKLANSIKNSGTKITVIESDMQAYYKRMLQNESKNAYPSCTSAQIIDPVNYNTGSMAGYLTYNEMLAELDQMRSLYPNLITVKAPISNFLTQENRGIQFVKISDNPGTDENEKKILFNAVHHAREPGSMQQLIYFMWYILENYATNPEIKALIDNTEIYCVPVVNPDGYVYNQTTNPNGGGYWRKNRKKHSNGTFGVDNNRNYSYKWGTTGVSTTDTSNDTYCGTAPFTEPENKAIKWLCEQKKFDVAFSNHTFSSLVLFPFGYDNNKPTPDNTMFEGISAEMVKVSGYTNEISAALYPASGDTDDWMYGDTSTKPKIFAFTPEIGTNFWDTPAQTKINNYNMLHTNMTALRFLHNYAFFNDKTDSFVSQANYAFNYSLKRIGLVDNQNFIVKIVPVSANITSVGNPNTHSNIAFGATINGALQINLASNIQNGTPIVFKVEVNNGDYIQSETITKYYGTPTVKLNEPGNAITQWTSNGWGVNTQTFYSASASITDSATGNYANNAAKSISTTNPIDLNNVSKAELTFYAKWDIEKEFDYVELEISKDNGATWIAQCGKFTALGKATQDLNKPIYDGKQPDWVKEQIDLSEYINAKILIRFRIKTDAQNVRDGFYFDDLKVTTLPTPTLGVTENTFETLNIVPNPVTNHITLSTIEGLENYKIYDISGKTVAKGKLESENIDVSTYSQGIYILEVSKESLKKQIRFIVKR
jgi:carboxypeptidase T